MKGQPGVVECLECRTVLVSNTRDAFVQCGCLNGTFVDGGRDYLRYGGRHMDLIRPLQLVLYPKRRKK